MQDQGIVSAIPSPVADSSSLRDHLAQRFYTVPELMRLTGMTRKQVAYWAKLELVTPTIRDPVARRGQPAYFYSAQDVVKALIVSELRHHKFSLQQIRQIASNLQEHDIQLDKSEAYLLTDGYSVYYAFSDGEVVDVLKHRRQMLLLVPIHEHVAKLQEVA